MAVTTSDNTLHVVDASRMREEWSLRSLSWSSQEDFLPIAKPSRILDGYLVCNGAPGSCRLWTLTRAASAGRTRWSSTRACPAREKFNKVYAPAVLFFDFLKTCMGPCISTIDARRGDRASMVYSLKFGYRQQEGQVHSVRHGEPPRTQCSHFSEFLPERHQNTHTNYVITTAEDGYVKLWNDLDTAPRGADMRLHIPSQRQFCEKCACSMDASLLALAQGNVVSVWDPMTVSMKTGVRPELRLHLRGLHRAKAGQAVGGGSGKLWPLALPRVCVFTTS